MCKTQNVSARVKALRAMLVVSAVFVWANGANAALIAHWQFNEGSGTTTADSTGNLDPGTLGGSPPPQWVVGHPFPEGDYALKFNDNTTGNFIQFDNKDGWLSRPGDTNEVTVAAWVQNSSASGDAARVLGLRQVGTSRFILQGPGDGSLSFWLSGHGRITTGPGVVPMDQWSHVAATYSYSDGLGTGMLYVNGALVHTENSTYAIGSTVDRAVIGHEASGADRAFVGTIDDLRLYDRALTRPEILALLPEPSPPFTLPQYFDFGDNKYQHTQDPSNWRVLAGHPGSISYETDAVRVAGGSGGIASYGLLAEFDDLGGGKDNDFVVSMDFDVQASSGSDEQWNRFQLWALADESLATGGDGNTGYVLSVRTDDRDDARALALIKGGYYGEAADRLRGDANFPLNVGDNIEFELSGRYGEEGGTEGLFLDVQAWNHTQGYSVVLDTYFDPDPPDASGFGFGVRRHPQANAATMDVYRFSVVPEPGSLMMLVAGAMWLLLYRRRAR